MASLMNYIAPFIILVITVVVIHELGHYFVARLFKVDIDEFSVGFGKKLFSYVKKGNKTAWCLRLIPMGGFVKMSGEEEDLKINPNTTIKIENSLPLNIPPEQVNWFAYKKIWQKFLIVLAGPAANYLLAIFLYILIFWFSGMNVIDPIVKSFPDDSGAKEAGMKEGDRIISLNGKKISSYSDLKREMLLLQKDNIDVKIERDQEIISLNVTPKIVEKENSFNESYKDKLLGIITESPYHVDLNLFQSFKHSFSEVYQVSSTSLRAIGQILTGQRSVREISGPIKIAQYSGQASSLGFKAYITLMAFFSVSLGLMNLFPLPMLDGGHLFFYIIEMITRKPLPAVVHRYLPRIGMAFFAALTTFVIINDCLGIFKIFNNVLNQQ